MVSWSHTALHDFEGCPRRYNLVRRLKKYREAESPALKEGREIHTAIQKNIEANVSIEHLELPSFINTLNKIKAKAQYPQCEMSYALTEELKPCTWYDPRAWVRGIIDFLDIQDEYAIILDWKTGKRRLEVDQLLIFALLLFAHEPDITKTKTGFVWVKENRVDQITVLRDQEDTLWGEFRSRVALIESAIKFNSFDPKPSGLCAYCPVDKKGCEYSKK